MKSVKTCINPNLQRTECGFFPKRYYHTFGDVFNKMLMNNFYRISKSPQKAYTNTKTSNVCRIDLAMIEVQVKKVYFLHETSTSTRVFTKWSEQI